MTEQQKIEQAASTRITIAAHTYASDIHELEDTTFYGRDKAAYEAGATAERELINQEIEHYKKICEIAGVPKLLIENPGLIKGQLPTDEQIRRSWETIKKWEQKNNYNENN